MNARTSLNNSAWSTARFITVYICLRWWAFFLPSLQKTKMFFRDEISEHPMNWWRTNSHVYDLCLPSEVSHWPPSEMALVLCWLMFSEARSRLLLVSQSLAPYKLRWGSSAWYDRPRVCFCTRSCRSPVFLRFFAPPRPSFFYQFLSSPPTPPCNFYRGDSVQRATLW